jgi:hypothetical protein
MSDIMNSMAELDFTDEQIVAAVKAGPEALRTQVAIIAMQLELQERRAADHANS